MEKLNKEDKYQRLACGCLVSCGEEENTWIEYPQCMKNPKRCKIDNYLKEHKTCLICGKCLKCFKHKECNRWWKIPEKIYTWIYISIWSIIRRFR